MGQAVTLGKIEIRNSNFQTVSACGLAFVVLLVLFAYPPIARAHQLDEYLQATLVAIEPGEIRLHMNLTPGVEVADMVLAAIDRDGDGEITTAEAAAYAGALKDDLVVQLDGRRLELTPAKWNFPPLEDLRTGWGMMQVEYAVACGAISGGPHTLSVQNRHQHRVSAYLLNAALPATNAIQVTAQRRNYNQSSGEIDFTCPAPAAAPRSMIATAGALAALLAATAGWVLRRF
jgi:hypothetical protein